jgi:hypothetical protein
MLAPLPGGAELNMSFCGIVPFCVDISIDIVYHTYIKRTGETEMMNLRYRKMDLTLNNNELTGNTYPVKGFISEKLGGKWDATKKAWIVDVALVDKWIKAGAITVHGDSQTEASKTSNRNNWYVNTRTGRELAEDF